MSSSSISSIPKQSSRESWRPFFQKTAQAFRHQHKDLCAFFQQCEEDCVPSALAQHPPKTFQESRWDRSDSQGSGHGYRAFLHEGRLWEKGAILYSKMRGVLSASLRKVIPGGEKNDGSFQATGVSLILHPRHPDIPSAHMNIRLIDLGEEAFFGGVCDLTPTRDHARGKKHEDTLLFHKILRAYHTDAPVSYQQGRDACSAYFSLPHRGHQRGMGGTFFEHLKADERGLSFLCALPQILMKSYGEIVKGHLHKPITPEAVREQRFWRGRYVEFVLLYDKGTRFGLETGGNVEAIFSSLPPQASWLFTISSND